MERDEDGDIDYHKQVIFTYTNPDGSETTNTEKKVLKSVEFKR